MKISHQSEISTGDLLTTKLEFIHYCNFMENVDTPLKLEKESLSMYFASQVRIYRNACLSITP